MLINTVARAAPDIPGLLENRKQGLAMLPSGGDVYDPCWQPRHELTHLRNMKCTDEEVSWYKIVR